MTAVLCFSAEISLVICDREEKAASLLENKEKDMTLKLSCLILFNEFSDAFVERAKKCDVEVLKYTQLIVGYHDLLLLFNTFTVVYYVAYKSDYVGNIGKIILSFYSIQTDQILTAL